MKRLLFIAHRVPYPPDKGERVRAFHEITALAQHYRITLAAPVHGRDDRAAARGLEPWCERIVLAPAGGAVGLMRGAWRLMSGRSVTEGFFCTARMAGLLDDEARREPFDLVFAYSSGTLPLALGAEAPLRIMDLVDVDSAKWLSYAESARWPLRWLYRREERGVRDLERAAVARCDAVLLVSDAEARALGVTSQKVMAVGNGVDMDYFRPAEPNTRGTPSLVFTGTMDYRPNVDGVCWFVREVWPLLRRNVPDLEFTIVGRNPARAVRALAAEPGVAVTGAVPDVRPYLAAARAVVIPLRIARGIQNKALEAMAMGRAVVGSPAAVEGLDVVVGEDLLQAESPDKWRDAVLGLLTDEPRRLAIEHSARRCVEQKYTWSARMAPLVELCRNLADSRPRAEAQEAHAPRVRAGGVSAAAGEQG